MLRCKTCHEALVLLHGKFYCVTCDKVRESEGDKHD
jgi:hypothetical protein